MNYKLLILLIAIACFSFTGSESFKSQQLKYNRVGTAYKEKWDTIKSRLTKAGVDSSHFEILLRVFKNESKMEVWAKSKNISQFKLIHTYDICRSSGGLGPKRREGDGQVPEGFYHVSAFQPSSEFYLALQVSYPNKADLINGDKARPGGDIMIHGNCVTIGCMPMTDDKIKEIYLMAVEARNNGQQSIPIYIFPTHMDDNGMALLKKTSEYSSNSVFWDNLKTGYTYFESKKTIPIVTIDDKGNYCFK